MPHPLILALIGVFLVALAALARASSARRAAEDAARDLERSNAALRAELKAGLGIQRRMLAKLVDGEELTKDMVEEGQLWRDIDEREAQSMLDGGGSLFLVDVRTPDETAAGIIPGATLIPMDDIESRRDEIPNDGTPILVYCAAGGRSAAVCDFLAQTGVDSLHNLTCGFGGWSGASEAPTNA